MEYNFKGTDLELIFGNKTKREIEEIIKDLKQKAETSDRITINIQFSLFLGKLYQYGFGVKKDYKESIKWYKKALKLMSRKNKDSDLTKNIEYVIGIIYLEDDYGLELNSQEALKFLNKAKEHGSIEALYKLGCLYRDGDIEGFEKNYQKAIDFFEEAHKKDHAEAMYELGLFYYSGVGVDLDEKKAIELFKKSKAKGNIRAEIILDLISSEIE